MHPPDVLDYRSPGGGEQTSRGIDSVSTTRSSNQQVQRQSGSTLPNVNDIQEKMRRGEKNKWLLALESQKELATR